MRSVGSGTVRGILHDLGAYPGALVDDKSDRTIRGRVLEWPTSTLVDVDAYEGYEEGNLDSLFVRQRCDVLLTDHVRVRCWIYAYNREIRSATQIADGDYSRYKRSHNFLRNPSPGFKPDSISILGRTP